MTIGKQNMINLEMRPCPQVIEYQVQIAPELVGKISRHLDDHPAESWDGLMNRALTQYLEVSA